MQHARVVAHGSEVHEYVVEVAKCGKIWGAMLLSPNFDVLNILCRSRPSKGLT